MNAVDEFLKSAQSEGWKIEIRENEDPDLGPIVPARFPNRPPELNDFLRRVRSCINGTDNAWFLSGVDYSGSGPRVWRWNEWELMSLEVASEDLGWQAEIERFWENHMPIALSVMGDYGHLSIRFTDRNPGPIVMGYEPTSDEVTIVASSYADLLGIMTQAVRDPDSYPEFGGFL